MFGLSEAQEQLWWGAVIGGFVVIVAVVVLLSLLVFFVATIHKRVKLIRSSLQAAADNTDNTALIGDTASSVEAVLNEGLNHHLFLGRVREKVRS